MIMNDNIDSLNSNIIDFRNQKMIEKFWMPIDEFLKIQPVPMQRYTEGRAKNNQVKKMLSRVTAEQLEVAIVELTEDSDYIGTQYKKGWQGVLNGNTRSHFWREGKSKTIPKEVYVTKYKFDSMARVRESYDSFDSMDATEKKYEKVFGYLVRSYGFDPDTTCSKLIKGQILSGLNISCFYYDPDRFNQPVVKTENLPEMLSLYMDELKIFNEICQNEKSWDQALLAAALMSIKKWGKDHRLIKGLKRIDMHSQVISEEDGKHVDGITHIVREWTTRTPDIPSKTTNWDKPGGLKETLAYALYFIQLWMKDEKVSQRGYNWQTSASNFFPQNTKKFKTVTNNLNNLFSIPT